MSSDSNSDINLGMVLDQHKQLKSIKLNDECLKVEKETKKIFNHKDSQRLIRELKKGADIQSLNEQVYQLLIELVKISRQQSNISLAFEILKSVVKHYHVFENSVYHEEQLLHSNMHSKIMNLCRIMILKFIPIIYTGDETNDQISVSNTLDSDQALMMTPGSVLDDEQDLIELERKAVKKSKKILNLELEIETIQDEIKNNKDKISSKRKTRIRTNEDENTIQIIRQLREQLQELEDKWAKVDQKYRDIKNQINKKKELQRHRHQNNEQKSNEVQTNDQGWDAFFEANVQKVKEESESNKKKIVTTGDDENDDKNNASREFNTLIEEGIVDKDNQIGIRILYEKILAGKWKLSNDYYNSIIKNEYFTEIILGKINPQIWGHAKTVKKLDLELLNLSAFNNDRERAEKFRKLYEIMKENWENVMNALINQFATPLLRELIGHNDLKTADEAVGKYYTGYLDRVFYYINSLRGCISDKELKIQPGFNNKTSVDVTEYLACENINDILKIYIRQMEHYTWKLCVQSKLNKLNETTSIFLHMYNANHQAIILMMIKDWDQGDKFNNEYMKSQIKILKNGVNKHLNNLLPQPALEFYEMISLLNKVFHRSTPPDRKAIVNTRQKLSRLEKDKHTQIVTHHPLNQDMIKRIIQVGIDALYLDTLNNSNVIKEKADSEILKTLGNEIAKKISDAVNKFSKPDKVKSGDKDIRVHFTSSASSYKKNPQDKKSKRKKDNNKKKKDKNKNDNNREEFNKFLKENPGYCYYHSLNKCEKGSNCRYKHDDEEDGEVKSE